MVTRKSIIIDCEAEVDAEYIADLVRKSLDKATHHVSIRYYTHPRPLGELLKEELERTRIE